MQTTGLNFTIAGFSIKGAGVLTGEFSNSSAMERYVPVMDIFGPGFGEMVASTLGLIAILMLVATHQRRGRPPLYPSPRQPQLHLSPEMAVYPVNYAHIA